MRFDLDTLDSGERSLPFGLLVITIHCNTQIKTINGGWRLFHNMVKVMNRRARREDVRLFDKVFQ